MANKTHREHCKRCKVEVTAADHEAGQCTDCGYELPQRPMPKVRTKLRTLLQKRMPKLTKARDARRTQKLQDVDEVLARHARLIELAARRGYSVKALTGLVRAAEDAYQLARA